MIDNITTVLLCVFPYAKNFFFTTTDPTTKKWLADSVDKVFGFPQLVRFSWSTCSNILDSKAVPVHW